MALPTYKNIVDLIKKGATIEAQEQIMALREPAIDLQDENRQLSDRVRELEGQLRIKGQIRWEKPHYWLVENGTRDGPFCQRCYDADGKLIRVQGGDDGIWICRACGNHYTN